MPFFPLAHRPSPVGRTPWTGLSARALRHSSLGWALGGAATALVALPTAALAQETGRGTVSTYSIAAGPLGEVLSELSARSGVQLVFDAQPLAGLRSAGVQGSLSLREAYARALGGSGYEAVSTGPASNSYVLRRLAPAGSGPNPGPGAGTAMLPTITASAQTGSLASELQPAHAGGQVARGGRMGVLGNRDLMDTPFTQTNYTAELVQNQQVNLISQVLDNDPSAQSTNAAVGHDGMNFRGFNMGNGFALFNGLQNVVSGTVSVIPAESFERIEVLKGPSAALNGNIRKIGGVINLVPKRAGVEPLTQINLDHASGGTVGTHADIGRRFGPDKAFGARVNLVHRDGGTLIDHYQQRTSLATLGLDYQGERLRLDADIGHQKVNVRGMRRMTRFADGVLQVPAPDNRRNWFDPSDYSDASLTYGALRAEYDLDPALTAFAAVGGSELEYARQTQVHNLTSSAGDLAAGTLGSASTASVKSAYSFEGGLRGRLATGALRHAWTVAYSHSFTRDEADIPAATVTLPRSPATNIHAPVFGPRPVVIKPGFATVARTEESVLSGVTLADTVSTPDDRLSLTAGLRLQRVEVSGFDRGTGARTQHYDESAVTPVLAVVYKPWPSFSAYASYVEGLQQGPVAPESAVNAREVFAPFKTRQYEIGVKQEFGTLTGTVALYQIAQPSAFTDSRTLVYGIDGEQRHRGVDVNVFGSIDRRLRLLGGVAYIDSRLTKTENGAFDGNDGVGAPRWRTVMGAEWDTPWVARLTLTGRVITNSATYLNAANTQSIPRWTRVDIGARYAVDRSLTLRAGIENVFDRNYWTTSGEREVVLSLPRSLKVSASYTF